MKSVQLAWEIIENRAVLLHMEYDFKDINSKFERPCGKDELPLMFKSDDNTEFIKTILPTADVKEMAKLQGLLFKMMGESKLSPREILNPDFYLINGTHWRWTHFKNAKRDYIPLIQSAIVEKLIYPLYRQEFLKGSYPARKMRYCMKQIMDNHAQKTKRIVINNDGRITAPVVREYLYPDLIPVEKDLGEAPQSEEFDTFTMLKRLTKHERRAGAEKSVNKIIVAIRSSPYSHIDGDISNPLSPEMDRLIKAMVVVR
jgi:hypothetical protein